MRTFAQKPKAAPQTISAKSAIYSRGKLGQSRNKHSILHPQRMISNQVGKQLLQPQTEELKATEELKIESTNTLKRSFSHDFSRIPVHIRTPSPIQTKLAINRLGDLYEQEADWVADHVTRMPEPLLQGKCPWCKNGEVDEKKQMRKIAPMSLPQSELPSIVHDVLRSPAQTLEPSIRAFFEPRFGYDFSNVRVHANEEAAEAANSINASAFTVGHDIAFGANQFSPGTRYGRHLIAHELVHVMQQAGGGMQHMVVQRVVGGTTPDPSNPDEMTRVDATGHYESVVGSQRVTLQLNQAGQHLLGWWQTHAGGTDLAYYNIEDGEVTDASDNRTEFHYSRQRMIRGRPSGQAIVGSLVAIRRRVPGTQGGFENVLEVNEPRGAGRIVFAQISSAPRLSQEAIATMPGQGSVRELIRSAETSPLDEEDRVRVWDAANQIHVAMMRYLRTGQEGPGAVAVARDVDRLVHQRIGYFGRAQLPIAVRTLREYLASTIAEVQSANVWRPIWDWLQVMVIAHPEGTVTGHVQEYLGMTPRGPRGRNTPQHHYQYKFRVLGLAGEVPVLGGLGGFYGPFWIRELSPGRWVEEYTCYIGQLSASAGGGVQVGQESDWTSFYSPLAWTSGNFHGPFGVLAASVSVVPGEGRSVGFGTIVFEGDNSMPALHADAGGVQTVLGWQAGAEYNLQQGYLTGGQAESRRETPAHEPVREHSSHRIRSEFAHFAVNDPSLNAEGWRALREMCARHRAAFESEGSILEIHGYASTTGPEARNTPLSRLRALNVLTAIRDILGPAYRIPRPRGGDDAIAIGHGESDARAAAERTGRPPDNLEDPYWRRVDVKLNGSVVLELFGAP